MTESVSLDDIVAKLRVLMQQEYQRGQADTTRRILEAAQTPVRTDSSVSFQTAVAERSDEGIFGGTVTRAGRGVPDALIVRVLSKLYPGGATSTAIMRMAESDAEQKVSLSGIRFALDRGKKSGRYKTQNGDWFLTKDPAEAGSLER
jgi:hypothetical protein